MSVLMVAWGSASNSAQFHSPTMASPSSRAKVQFSTFIWGVGPAERTGKSVVTYCPGGSRFFGVCSCRLDLKPREMGGSLIAASSLDLWRGNFVVHHSSLRGEHCDGLALPRQITPADNKGFTCLWYTPVVCGAVYGKLARRES